MHHAAIRRVSVALDEAARLQVVEDDGDRVRREADRGGQALAGHLAPGTDRGEHDQLRQRQARGPSHRLGVPVDRVHYAADGRENSCFSVGNGLTSK